ncbi:MAG: 5-oxoprolinase subunit PxpB [Henriciella sp.]|nr:5-oxoprolinase subunit PxpB [Henriciella sp.]
MSAGLIPIRIADDVFEFKVETPAQAQALASYLREDLTAEDVVAGLDRVAVRFAPEDLDHVTARLAKVKRVPTAEQETGPAIEISVKYGGEAGPDLEQVCEALDLTIDAFIALHTGNIHTVEMIGFTPGFSYISGLPDDFAVPRLDNPRPRVAAGSVGISAGFTGIYALQAPGGWPLIGRTDAMLFDADRDSPFLLSPGQQVRFRAT